MRLFFGLIAMLSVTVSGCNSPTESPDTSLHVQFGHCLGHVDPTLPNVGTAPTCRAALAERLGAATPEAPVNACLLLKGEGQQRVVRAPFRWETSGFLPLEHALPSAPASPSVAVFFIFDSPRVDCGGVDPTDQCQAVEGCVLRLHDEGVRARTDGAVIDFRSDVGVCNVGAGDFGIRQRCQGCSWPRAACEPGAEEIVPCGGACGARTRVCAAHCAWAESECVEGECVPASVEEQSCGRCGVRRRTCSLECAWSPFSECRGELSTCSPGEEESVPCGDCGLQRRVCDAECAWETGACEAPPDACAPGTIDDSACEPGGAKRVCNDVCEWTETPCDDPGPGCVLREMETVDCGVCGEQTRACEDDGDGGTRWGSYGPCEVSQTACRPDAVEERRCGVSVGICLPGSELRTCGAACQWGPWSECEGGVQPMDNDICANGIDEDCDGRDNANLDQYDLAAPNDDCRNPTRVLESTYEEGELIANVHNLLDRDVYQLRTEWVVEARWRGGGFVEFELEDVEGGRLNYALYPNLESCESGDNALLSGTTSSRARHGDFFSDEDVGEHVFLVIWAAGEMECRSSYSLEF